MDGRQGTGGERQEDDDGPNGPTTCLLLTIDDWSTRRASSPFVKEFMVLVSNGLWPRHRYGERSCAIFVAHRCVPLRCSRLWFAMCG